MTLLAQATLVAAAASLMAISPAIASATPTEPTGAAVMPMVSKFRACDFTAEIWVNAGGDARGVTYLSTSGSNVVANVDLATAEPNTHYDVRIIQTPRPSMGCAPGAPGVITGGLQTDAGGAGHTTLQGPIESNATGAWVMIQRPAANSLTPEEFYTSEFVGSI